MSNIASAIARKQTQNPQFEYMFRVVLPDLGIEPIQSTAAFNLLAQTGDGETSGLISERVHSISTPFTSYETTKHVDRDSYWYSAGGSDIGNISLRVDEYEDGETLKYFLKWQARMGNGDGTHNPPVEYKRDITMFKLSSSGRDIHYHTYTGYYPITIGDASHSNDSSQILQYNITLSGDSVTHTFLSASRIREMIESDNSAILDGVDSPMQFETLLRNEFNRQLSGTSELFKTINTTMKRLKI